MLEPYSAIQGREAHGDIIVWPLKALCDYVEATGDFAFLDERVAWRREDNFERTAAADPVATHVDKLIATVRATLHPRHIPVPLWERRLERLPSAGRSDETRLDGKQSGRSRFSTSSFAATPQSFVTPERPPKEAKELDSLAAAMRKDFNRFLIRDGIVAGYGVFRPEGGAPELLLHPSDKQTGSPSRCFPMTQGIIGGNLHASTGAAPSRPHPQASPVFRWRAPHGQADRLSRRA